jgi:hypothetical protein
VNRQVTLPNHDTVLILVVFLVTFELQPGAAAQLRSLLPLSRWTNLVMLAVLVAFCEFGALARFGFKEVSIISKISIHYASCR